MKNDNILSVDREELAKRKKGGNTDRLSKSSFMFNVKKSYIGSSKLKNNQFRKLKYESKNVVIKITGSASSSSGIRQGIDYISRDGELPVYNEDGFEFLGKDDLELAKSDFYDDLHLHKKGNKKLVLNMVFSPPPSENVSEKDAVNAVRNTLKILYPYASYIIAYHNDKEEHPHVHLNLKLVDKNGKKFNIRKPDLEKIKSTFADELVKLNYKATHKIRQNKAYKEFTKSERNIFEVVSFGEDSYNFEKGNKTTPYIQLKTKNNAEFYVWGVELKEKIQEFDIKNGDSIYIKKLNKVEVEVPVFDEHGNIRDLKKVFRNNWQIDNLSRKSNVNTSEFLKDKDVISYSDNMKKKKLTRAKKVNEIIINNRLKQKESDKPVMKKRKSKFNI